MLLINSQRIILSATCLRESIIESRSINSSDTQENDNRKLCAVLGTRYGVKSFRSMLMYVN